jgi:hypothetical protein
MIQTGTNFSDVKVIEFMFTIIEHRALCYKQT